MGKTIPVKDAIKKWESHTGQKALEATVVKLNGFHPPIDKLDVSIANLVNCEKLSLSTNLIDKLTNLQTLSKLKILSIGRNLLKSLVGIECLSETLEELWASYNQVEKIKPLSVLKNLKVLYLSNNAIKDANELKNLTELLCLNEVVLVGCPMQINVSSARYRSKVSEFLPQVKMLDGAVLIPKPEKVEEEEIQTAVEIYGS